MLRRQKPKYRLPRSRRRKGPGPLVWLVLLLALLVTVIWWLWPERRPHAIRAQPANVSPPIKTANSKPLRVVNPLPFPPVKTVPAPTALSTNALPPVAHPSLTSFPRSVTSLFEAQVALARTGISSGSIDGVMGSQTHLALRQFQHLNHLPVTGALDDATRQSLTLDASPFTEYTVSTNDLARLQPLGKTWLEKSRQSALDYESELELVGEFSHASPAFIRQLNPRVRWNDLAAGTVLKIPDIQYPDPPDQAATIVIHLSGKYLEAFDVNTNLLLHCPCSIAAHVEKRPVGLLHVIVVAPNPNYTFDPAVFPESPEARQIGHKLVLPPGPNNPVGVAWMGLDRPGYGMHGTPAPEQVGRTESHGCFRLANWDAAYLVKLVWLGMPVVVQP